MHLQAPPKRVADASSLTVSVTSFDPDYAVVQPYVMPEGLAARLGQLNPDAALREAEVLARRRAAVADKFLGLASKGRLHPLEVLAGDEIALVRQRQSGALSSMVKVTYAQRLAPETGGGIAMWMTVEDMERNRYLPWRRWALAYPLNPEHSLQDLTLWLVEEGLGIRQAAGRARVDQRRAERLLRRSLWHYATLAGWCRGEPPQLEA